MVEVSKSVASWSEGSESESEISSMRGWWDIVVVMRGWWSLVEMGAYMYVVSKRVFEQG